MEYRYYLSNKKTWNDVTTAVVSRKTPKEGDMVNVGKIRMKVTSVVQSTIHGTPIMKVMLESTDTGWTIVDEAVQSATDEVTIINVVPEVNEAIKFRGNPSDTRVIQRSNMPGIYNYNQPLTTYGPGSNVSLGGFFRSGLQLGMGYSVQVVDFGEAITINISYTNSRTGVSTGQSFVVVYHGDNKKYPYRVYSTNVRWRDCPGYDQAISYIRSKCSAIQSRSSSTL